MAKMLLVVFLLVTGPTEASSEATGQRLTLRMFVQVPDVCIEQKSLDVEVEIANSGRVPVNIGKAASTTIELEVLSDPRESNFVYSNNVEIQDTFTFSGKDLIVGVGKSYRSKLAIRLDPAAVDGAGFYQVRLRQTFSRKAASGIRTTSLESNWVILRIQPCN